MAEPDPLKPTYVYKLTPSTTPPPSPLPSILPVSPLDRSSGFIHLSTSLQVLNTLKFFFPSDPKVFVLRIPYSGDVEKNIRWEDPKAEVCGPRGGEGMFPHLYNGLKLGEDEVDSVRVLERDLDKEDGWEEALKNAEGWLVY
ncbi:hypothetical protein BXZ70DRAFT_1009435 [Cristinia sonorae]|uniref:DUF952 domain-containing protein n=1 Tax=Cristinia sonorae TaxID=1940300 RepID=A0A8K0UL42_9AGAR|nr:hypothetical protein BXZ70DRAFT_1009435 [Cristinia sonorae]